MWSCLELHQESQIHSQLEIPPWQTIEHLCLSLVTLHLKSHISELSESDDSASEALTGTRPSALGYISPGLPTWREL